MKHYAFITEISQQETPVSFIPYYQHVYYGNTLNTYAEIGSYLYPDDYKTIDPETYARLVGIRIKETDTIYVLQQATTLASCITNKESFYYDGVTKDFFVHFPNHKPPDYWDKQNIIFEIALGFFKGNYEGQLLINNTPYDKRLTAYPTIKKTLDEELKGLQKFTSFSVSIDNTDGKFEGWINDPLHLSFPNNSSQKKLRGNLIRYLAMSSDTEADLTDYSKYTLIQQGAIDSLSDGSILKFDCIDLRKTINEEAATNSIGSAQYEDIEDGTIKPWIFGKKYGLEVVCLNEKVNDDATPSGYPTGYSNYKYLLCDTDGHEIATDAIKNVFIDAIEKDITLPTVLFDTTNKLAYFELSHENFSIIERTSGGAIDDVKIDNQDKVSVNVEGYLDPTGDFTGTEGNLIDRGMNQIRYLLNKIRGDRFTDLVYNTTQWSLYEDDTNYNFKTGLSITKPTKGYKIIEDIANKSLFSKFQIDPTRRYTWDSDDFSGSGIASEFEKTKLVPGWFTGSAVSKKFDNILPFFWVEYQSRDDEKQSQKYYDNSFQTTAFANYGITGGEDKTIFETALVEQADVVKFAARIHELTDIPAIQLNIRLNDWDIGTGTKSQELNPGDFIRVELEDDGDVGYGYSIIKILEIQPDTGGVEPGENDWTVLITGRIIKWEPDIVLTDDDDYQKLTTDDDFGKLSFNKTTAVS
jgi:hypothetical protein